MSIFGEKFDKAAKEHFKHEDSYELFYAGYDVDILTSEPEDISEDIYDGGDVQEHIATCKLPQGYVFMGIMKDSDASTVQYGIVCVGGEDL